MKEKTYTLEDIKKMQSPINRRNKKLEIEKRNLAASLKIAAHNKLMKDDKKRDVYGLKDQIAEQIKNDQIPIDAYLKIFDSRINDLSGKVKVLEDLKEANGGFLKPGAESQLKMFTDALNKIINEKKEFIENKEIEEKAKAEIENAKLKKIEEDRINAEVLKRLELAKEEEAKIGREALKKQIRAEVERENLERKLEARERNLPIVK